MRDILSRFSIFTEELLPDCTLTGGNPAFWRFLNRDIPGTPVDLFAVFDELVGREEEVARVLNAQDASLRIPSVFHNDTYYNLFLYSPQVESPAMVVVQDSSGEMQKHQSLVQKHNEIILLSRKLEEKSLALEEANMQMESFLSKIRSREHTLNVQMLRHSRELQETRLWSITTLAQAAEFRETDTGGHIYRIGRSSVLIGKHLGLDTAQCEELFYSCLLHDVGKIGIPDVILLKPGPLDREEWFLMRQHTQMGANLLSRNRHPLFSSARDVALYHHEHWDGTGYPEGLSGTAIPLQARICAVADVFDALVSRRVYKESWDFTRARKTIEQSSGSHFDPDIVTAFISVLPEIQSLSKDCSEELEFLEPEFGPV